MSKLYKDHRSKFHQSVATAIGRGHSPADSVNNLLHGFRDNTLEFLDGPGATATADELRAFARESVNDLTSDEARANINDAFPGGKKEK